MNSRTSTSFQGRKRLFNLGMAVSSLSLQPGQTRTHREIAAFINAAGLSIRWQAIWDIERRALRKCRRMLGAIAKEHLER